MTTNRHGPPKEVGPGVSARATSTTPIADSDSSRTTGQMRPIGPEPSVADLLVGALMYSTAGEAAAVLALVHDDDIDPPLSTVLSAVRRLADSGVTPSPQLVLDALKRTGSLKRQVATTLMSATTTGACSSAARYYAAAVVAESLRRCVESAGAALGGAANCAPESDLAPLVERAAAAVQDCARRLESLRGESI